MAKPSRNGEYPGEIVKAGTTAWMWVGDAWREVGIPVETPGDALPMDIVEPPEADL